MVLAWVSAATSVRSSRVLARPACTPGSGSPAHLAGLTLVFACGPGSACRTDNGSINMNPAYRKGRVLALLGAILLLIVVDHLSSPTFAFNSGQGNVQTALSQKDDSA